jgi:insulysin
MWPIFLPRIRIPRHSELGWRFTTPGAPGPHAQSLAQNLLKYPESLVIAGPRRMALRTSDNVFINSEKPRTNFASNAQFDDTVKSTSQLLTKLTVGNCIVTVVSKSFDGKAKKQEKWYGTKYNVRPLSPRTANQWLNCKSASNYGIDYPRPNLFIPEEKGLIVKKPVRESDKRKRPPTLEERLKPITPPKLIRDDGDNGRWTVYFKQDDTFGQPKSLAIFQILTKDTFSSPIKAVLAALYQVSANDRLQEYAYDASLADLSYDIQVLPRGVRLTFGGYNDKLLDFATYISKKLSKDVTTLLPDSNEEFERYRDELRRAYAGFDVQQPYSHAIYYTNLLLQPKAFQYTNAELRDAIEKVNLNDLADYVKKIWDSGKAEALLQGNLDQKEALQFVEVIDTTLAFETMPAKDVPGRLKPLPIPMTSSDSAPIRISTAEANPSNTNTAVQVTFQCLDPSEKAHVVVEVLNYIVTERFYEDLRTKQQVRIVFIEIANLFRIVLLITIFTIVLLITIFFL